MLLKTFGVLFQCSMLGTALAQFVRGDELFVTWKWSVPQAFNFFASIEKKLVVPELRVDYSKWEALLVLTRLLNSADV